MVVARRPAQHLLNPAVVGDQFRRVTGAARRGGNRKVGAGYALRRVQHLGDAVTAAIAAVQNLRLRRLLLPRKLLQIGERAAMRVGDVVNMNVIAHAGAVAGVVVGAVHGDAVNPPGGGAAGHCDQMFGGLAALADAGVRVGAGDIEIAQNHAVETGGAGDVRRHHLAGQFGAAVRVDWPRRRVFGDRLRRRRAIDRRG